MPDQSELNDAAVTAQLQREGRLPSLVVALMSEGEIDWYGGAGAAPRGRAILDTQYRIGSITKTMTAALVMQCRDEGLLDLDDPLGRWIPDTGYADATLRGLLAHTAGLQSEPLGPWWERSPGTDFETLNRINDGSGRVGPAGVYFHYSNLGYALLGEVVARVRRATWWEVLHQRLLVPLDMDRTTYDAAGRHALGQSVDHFAGTVTREPHHDTGAMAPAGQVWSTLSDLATWVRCLSGRRADVLAAATVAEMSRASAPATDYGLGLRLHDLDGHAWRGHTGSMPGFQASLFVGDSDWSPAVIALTNATTGLDSIEVVGRFMGERDVGAVIEPPTDRWVPSQSVPDVVTAVLGVWFWGNTATEWRWQDGRLEVRALQGATLSYTFEVRDDDTVVGATGYHRGETLHVHETHLEVATFIYTRVPYDPRAPIPGR